MPRNIELFPNRIKRRCNSYLGGQRPQAQSGAGQPLFFAQETRDQTWQVSECELGAEADMGWEIHVGEAVKVP